MHNCTQKPFNNEDHIMQLYEIIQKNHALLQPETLCRSSSHAAT